MYKLKKLYFISYAYYLRSFGRNTISQGYYNDPFFYGFAGIEDFMFAFIEKGVASLKEE